MENTNHPMQNEKEVNNSNDAKIGQDMPNVTGKVPSQSELDRDDPRDLREVSSGEKEAGDTHEEPSGMPTEAKSIGGASNIEDQTMGNS